MSDQAAVEAVAKALYESSSPNPGGFAWDDLRVIGRASWLTHAKAAVEAMTAVGYAKRADVAEEIARAIEAMGVGDPWTRNEAALTARDHAEVEP